MTPILRAIEHAAPHVQHAGEQALGFAMSPLGQFALSLIANWWRG